MRLTALVFISIVLFSCGTDEDGTSSSGGNEPDRRESETEPLIEDEPLDEDVVYSPDSTPSLKPASTPSPLASNEWKDQLTGKVWLLGSKGTWANLGAMCVGSYEAADRHEILAAAQHGLLSFAVNHSGINSFWSEEIGAGDINTVIKSSNGVAYETAGNSGEHHGLVCMRVN